MRACICVLAVFALAVVGCATKKEETYRSNDDSIGSVCMSPLGMIPHGGSLMGYQSATVSAGKTCVQGPLTCKNGKTSGDFVNPTCKVLPK